ncbi:hypothetical protein CKA32_001262 [Geitlerinema sp. FC II]|nr:hypothetical protein CKA32_001262 [Geitlerinema sp. FC II]
MGLAYLKIRLLYSHFEICSRMLKANGESSVCFDVFDSIE